MENIKKKQPKETVHAQCHYCVQSRMDADVEGCTGYWFAGKKLCPFFPYRLGDKRMPIKIMRDYCLECMGGSRDAVRECTTIDCLIYPYRMGTNPARTGLGNIAHLAGVSGPSQGVSGQKQV